MSVFQTARGGLAIRATGGERVGDGDLNQMVDARLAAARVLGTILGGEGIYAGGAAALGDITTGTQYPAVTILIADDSGYLWPFVTTSATAITFNVTSTAAGDARLYAVPTMLAGVSPSAADGRYNQVRFVCDDVANAAPAHSLLLGTGTVTTSALSAYTASATLPAAPAVRCVPRVVTSDPKHATPGSRPAGLLGEVVVYSAKLYQCTNASTPTWEQVTSS